MPDDARSSSRGGVAATGALLLLAVAALVGLPAVRCEVFGAGCPVAPPAPAGPAADRPRQPTPLEAATAGRYVALGDSYSSGEGAYATAADAVPSGCRRTSAAYFHAVAERFDFAGGTAFWACSGATTRTVLTGKSGEPSQTGRLTRGTTLVTISAGGNDAGFSRVLAGCMVKVPFGDGCRRQRDDIAGRLAALRTSLAAVLRRVAERAPHARVIVLGYPRLFAETSGAFDNITVDDQRWLNSRGRDLNTTISEVAAEADRARVTARRPGSVEFVDAYSAFAGHEIGSSDPYINGLLVNLAAFKAEPSSFHPNVAGQRALAELVIGQVERGPGRALHTAFSRR